MRHSTQGDRSEGIGGERPVGAGAGALGSSAIAMAPPALVEQVTALVARREWEQVRAVLQAARPDVELDAPLLELAAEASWWLGRVTESVGFRREALAAHEAAGDRIGAARLALLLSEDHRRQGRSTVAESWRRRAARLLQDQPERPEHGYLLLHRAEVARRRGDLDDARAMLEEATGIARRADDADLAADVTQELGRVLISAGQPLEGLALMDEAMLAASDGGLSPYTTGKVYCCMISACDDLGDVQRVAEWEQSSAAWARLEGVNVFPGMCRVHHAELLAHFGRWSEAEQVAEQACEELREVGWIVAYAWTALGHLRSRRGNFDGAAEAFATADRFGAGGPGPEAGFALLLLARGDPGGGLRRITRALGADGTPLSRARLLPAGVELAVAAGDLESAEAWTAELEQTAARYGTSKLLASASTARGRLELARGSTEAACAALTQALQRWRDLSAPYELATNRVLLAQACLALGDDDGWNRSLDLAVELFTSLGAAADLARVHELRPPADGARPAGGAGLTAREAEVLGLLATGATNKEMAARLVVSQKTVARHLSNIFTKIGVSTRAAATAYAFRHGLVDR